MRRRYVLAGILGVALLVAPVARPVGAQFAPTIPRFWSDDLLHEYELPLATPEHTPRHVSSEYYEALPQRVLYRSYPVYRPDREPAGYFDRLKTLEPEVVFDQRTLQTESDWVEAGRLVFEMPIDYDRPLVEPADVRNAQWYERHAVPVAKDGTLPGLRWGGTRTRPGRTRQPVVCDVSHAGDARWHRHSGRAGQLPVRPCVRAVDARPRRRAPDWHVPDHRRRAPGIARRQPASTR